MGRIRAVFLLLAIALAVPAALLVRRAYESVELERAVRHRAVAERAFDELERALSDFLGAEEERPVAHYRFLYTPDESVGGEAAVVRSPLSFPSDARFPFVVGHFEVDADGRFATPLLPREDERAQAGPFEPGPEVSLRVARLERVARGMAGADGDVGGRTPAAKRQPDGKADDRQAPGTTLPIAKKEKDAELRNVAQLRDEVTALEEKSSPAESSYDALRAFNVGAEQRMQRSRKVIAQAPKARAYGRLDAPAPAADPEAVPQGQAAEGIASGAFESALEAEEGFQEEVVGAVRAPAAPARLSRAMAVPALEVDPFVARDAPGGEEIVLTRLVLRGGRAHRQGLVLDRAGLESWLAGGVPALARIPGARLGFDGEVASGDGYAFRHRFAEPFGAVEATLSLAPLRGTGGAGTVGVLSLALALAGGIGLFALYRMVAVTVGFAARRSNFVAAVSHELKTPLTAIRMYAEMLRDGMVDSDERRSEYYGTITAESERLSRLIQNVLDFSRLEKGTRDVELVVGPLLPVVEEAASVLRPHAERCGFRLEVDVPADLPPARFDRDGLLQVLFNLVDNAIKYARDATDKTVRIEARGEDGGVRLAVRDAGPGVAAGRLEKIFEPFYRGEDELTRTTQGAGIGLSLVRGLVERMGGAIRGRNLEGGGFEVSVRLGAA